MSMNDKIEKTMKNFKESTFLEGGHSFPGFAYASGVRISDLTNAQLAFQKEFMEQYTTLNKEPLTTTEIADIERAKFLIYEEMKIRNDALNTVKWPYIEAPYFTIEEINRLSEEGRVIDLRHRIVNNELKPQISYSQRIKELEDNLRNTDDPEEIEFIKNTLVSLGWNPEVDCTQENMIRAKNRIEKLYTKEMNEFCTFIDSSEFVQENYITTQEINKDIKPIFISIYENGSIRLYESPTIDKDIAPNADIFSIYTETNTADSILSIKNMFEEDAENVLFALPSNYACYTVVRNIHEAYGFEHRPVISKWNVDNNPDLKTIKSVCETFTNNINESADINNHKIYMCANVLT